MKQKLNTKILFMGTPQFAATALVGLVEAGFSVMGVVTQPDTKKGRSGLETPSEVKIEAEKAKIPVFQLQNKAELTELVTKLTPELIVVAAYGMIVPQSVLDVPKYGTLNIHGSLLPKYRGASPISEAILSGDEETGITIMKMSLGMDEGPSISNYQLPISNEDTTASLTTKMAKLGAKAIVETIPGWISGALKSTPQDDKKATYCKKLTKEDGHIDWNETAIQIERKVRAYNPWPTAYTFVDGKRMKMLRASCFPGHRPGMTGDAGALNFEGGHIYVPTGDGTLEILELQPEGKKPMSAKDYINGNNQSK
jgi:methionyl-tRNA formyltransferase